MTNNRKPEPAEIVFRNMRFLITDRPTDSNIDRYIEELKRHNARDVVRVCEPSYKTEKLEHAGITVRDWQFEDGNVPPTETADMWLSLLKRRFTDDPGCCIAVHCVAGLGRAPVLVAMALVESGMKYEDAVEMIRTKRRGAINARQLAYLEKYRSKNRLKMNNRQKSCVVM